MINERLIIENRSSRPLYESYDTAFNMYFEHWSEEYKDITMTRGDFKFYIRRNKKGLSIFIYDIDA